MIPYYLAILWNPGLPLASQILKDIPEIIDTREVNISKEHLKGAVHPYDYTVRPQKVTSESCPKYYELIPAFQKLTNIGALRKKI